MAEERGQTHAPAAPPPPLKIVGIGASAGGLAALRALLAQLPPDPGVAVVVVMHLAPDRESHLVELLALSSPMPVQQVTRTVALEPNRIFVIPPNANLSAIDTHLRLSDLEARRVDRAPIDHFFRTLAESHDGDAMGVVLTGGGSDGTLGLRRIREAGGVTIAQDPDEAEYASMPRSAIHSGMVDRVLPLAGVAAEVLRFARTRPRVQVADEARPRLEAEQDALQALFALVRERTGQDLHQYRGATILRRLHRRMQLQHVETLGAYLDVVRTHDTEARALFEDLLITVTEFFRDPEVYAALEHGVIPRLFEGKTSRADRLRLWSVGCSTGEEAYSLAMLLVEAAERRQVQPQMQVFASDLHEAALEKARQGVYPEEIVSDVPPERLARFFVHERGRYRVRSELRELVVFTAHNLLADPPFAHIDMVVCRNLLIYLKRRVQHEVFELFHYALAPDGLLLLGPSETLDRHDLFEAVPGQAGLFRKRPAAGMRPRRYPSQEPPGPPAPGSDAAEPPQPHGVTHARMVERYAPPSVLIGADDAIAHYSAHAGRYLHVPGGPPTHDVHRLVREPLDIALRPAVEAARRSGRPIRSHPLTVQTEGGPRRVVMSVRPADDPELPGFLLVIFDELDEAGPPPMDSEAVEPAAAAGALGGEPEAAPHPPQALVEELYARQDALQSANEELRAVVEELERSREELQSLNEELTTVNDENTRRVEELTRLNADLRHFHAAARIPTLFLDGALRIVRFTPQVEELFRVRHSDSGRPLSDMANRLDYPDLQEDARAVLEGRDLVEREVASQEGRWYLVRILPYRSDGATTDGVVITLVDITARKQAEQEALEAKAYKAYAESIVESLREPLIVLTPELAVKSVNRAFCEQFRVGRAETLGRKIYALGNGQWNIPALRRLLEDVLPHNDTFDDYQVVHDFETLGRRVMLLNARRLDHVQLVLLGIRDITEPHDADHTLRASEARFRALVNASAFVVYRMSPDWSEMWELDGRGFIADTAKPKADWLDEYIHPDDQPRVLAAIDEAVRHKRTFELEHRVRRVDGTLGWTLSRAVPLLNEAGEITEWFGAASDVSARHEAEEAWRGEARGEPQGHRPT